jgi:hypothetical protein
MGESSPRGRPKRPAAPLGGRQVYDFEKGACGVARKIRGAARPTSGRFRFVRWERSQRRHLGCRPWCRWLSL